jgi:hypothetical protein
MTKAAADLQEERFARLAAELRAPIAILRGALAEEEKQRDRLSAVVAQQPERREFEQLVGLVARNKHEQELEMTGAVAGLRSDLYSEGGLVQRMDQAIGDLQDEVKTLQIAPAKRVLTIVAWVAATAVALKMPEII